MNANFGKPSFPHLRLFAWLNIVFQVVFPLAVSFTPAIAGDVREAHFLNKPADSEFSRTRVYTLSVGETTASVAKKFNISLSALSKLNQFRVFAHGFNNLQPGDELDVPSAPLSSSLQNNPQKNRESTKDDETTNKIAGLASQAGGFLKNTHQGQAAASMARGMATGTAGGVLQQWLSHFGTARVQLNADEKFSLKNSQLDLLVPWYERSDMLVFSQGSLHRTDDRAQGNLGLGTRWFNDDWMLGANTFLDHDFSHEHTRAGLGLEYWRDYMKLGANSYMRLSGWKDSPDLTDYQERPANGWDIRAQAWLPALPQLGGKLVFEQYYGDEVALFGKDNRQSDPHAITAGINYTPFPLLTLGAEQRQGGSGKNDTRFDVSLTFQPGVSWRQQLDPAAVGAMRSLAGSRYDLVDRNNNIILEYRKKEVIHLHALDLVTGHPGEHKSLGVSVTSKYGLDHIDWEASSLLAAGGLIEADNAGGYNAVLPPYHQEASAVNTYTLTGVAVDKKGNRSGESHTQLTVETPLLDKKNSTFTPADSILAADGESKEVLTLTVKDSQMKPVDTAVQDIKIITTRGTGAVKAARAAGMTEATVSAPVKKSTGVYEVTVTAGTTSESLTLTPEIFGETLTAAQLSISRDIPNSGRSKFYLIQPSIVANNTESSELHFNARDVHGEVISGIAGRLSFGVKGSDGQPPAKGEVTVSVVKEDGVTGNYTASLSGTKADTWTVVPLYNNMTLGVAGEKVTLTASRKPDVVKSDMKIEGEPFVADGKSQAIVTFTPVDEYGNAIKHLGSGAVSFSVGFLMEEPDQASRRALTANAALQQDLDVGPVEESPDGVYHATLSGTRTGIFAVRAWVDAVEVSGLVRHLTLTADTMTVSGDSKFQAEPPEIEVGG
ncbi:hypothetical protein BL250_04745 [Erwinia sp. OLTSP20]|uniref:inverse autotransporter beta domain-containing protein n=1 Tax=unclassified Erwinia TaxID=2622719 RepID=UPI000C18CFC8|nr:MULTISPECIES: inverse autotransporter beta domain-containing protein [unclassified Erwinia]PIJ52274.1 hypothetical protein BV501_00720 [Erwinia sp. OAMSP11]PIJ75683.1 hypothetical protein BK416_00800 [Erwinia sp. OLSSP12]PIJ83644.1 hypothetical protein BLD46_09270 [Erwinia sp. OLMTSP26]PIJ84281.1 hypothetical protein BLD47_02765 [Erwinia sp. OLCASP19]PIJ88746.1 hypothetical protein BLD49_01075 [Erwinia sp. OLMDSP33]